MFKKVCIIFLFLISVSSNAADYIGSGKINFMQNAYGGWILSTDGANSNPDNCTKDLVILDSSHAQYDELYSFLLSYYMSGKNLNIYVSGCHSAGYKILYFVYSTA